MNLERVLAEIDAMTASERQVVRAHLEVLEGSQPLAAICHADSEEVRRTARELMSRFPESLRKLASP